MRILVDLLGYTGGRGGTETYVRHLLPGLVDALPDASFVALTGAAGADGVRAFFPGDVEVVPWVGEGRAAWALGEILAVGRAARRAGADVVWSPANFGPLTRGRAPRVVSVHDVIYHQVPGRGLERIVRAITARLMEATARSARAVVTVSSTAAGAIARHLGVERDRIEVIPNGGSLGAEVDDPWMRLAPLGIGPGRPLVFSTGNRMPHKNFHGLLAAVAALPPEQRPLTVVGGGGTADPLATVVQEHGLAADVVLPGWVDDDQLRALYQVASVYACPSLTEGFGLPIVDAMAAGVVVVANDVAVLREVGGAHALYADARDPRAFGAAITTALELDDAERAERVRAGRDWAAGFTWDAAATRLAAVLRRTAEERRS
ncbi:glycosyltransferase family 4 protein [Microbacterium trichothecenolyticum]|uniref:Glycosyltransferase involved in cell wall biosynthesis n=1 Tax=Microbacterium trichothecenolyticum TaxID=69370 RepID=A0ABU0TTI1_MICTR|nr:glycosyltransferase family 1 protein [Microbacterium trichothecenolyticum]MDQ1122960.1 glycosyltransferase involved in cell wall biosynthesis [Microbacterium trichothecenolyticum]